MGAWGTAIFSDDFACDVRNDYQDQLIAGKTKEEASQEIIRKYVPEINGTVDEPVFWFALALAQWQKGRLLNDVKEKAIEFIDKGSDLESWNTAGNEKNYKKRKQVLTKLRDTLLSPMPPEKKIKKPSWIWTSPWREGALLTYKIKNPDANERYIDKYVLLRVISVLQTESSGYITESIRIGLYGWVGDEIPDSKIVDNLEFIVLSDTQNSMLGRMYFKTQYTEFRKTDQIEREIICIGNDESYKNGVPEFFRGHQEYQAYALPGALDVTISDALDNYFRGKIG